ncbi:MAG: RNase adapter RapZ [Pseudomonadota bacterium]
MRILIITGLSGSGKSVALNTLEDDDFNCVDNLPVKLLPTFIDQCLDKESQRRNKIAIGIDARSGHEDIDDLVQIVQDLKQKEQDIEVLFFSAEINTLIKRFSETRRKHPLTNHNTPLIKAIYLEKEILSKIADFADLTIDTTKTNVRQLRALVKKVVVEESSKGLTIVLQSFGFKHGVPNDSDFMFDVRCLPNPYWQPNLRHLTGKDTAVRSYLGQYREVDEMIASIIEFMEKWIPLFEEEDRSYLTISIGCTGGHHRSVYCINQIAHVLAKKIDHTVTVRHREFE